MMMAALLPQTRLKRITRDMILVGVARSRGLGFLEVLQASTLPESHGRHCRLPAARFGIRPRRLLAAPLRPAQGCPVGAVFRLAWKPCSELRSGRHAGSKGGWPHPMQQQARGPPQALDQSASNNGRKLPLEKLHRYRSYHPEDARPHMNLSALRFRWTNHR
jgi:hypothetical protein